MVHTKIDNSRRRKSLKILLKAIPTNKKIIHVVPLTGT